jgi:hypothetical protein
MNNNKEFAIIDNGIVENIISCISKEEAESIFQKECIEITLDIRSKKLIEIGIEYDGTFFKDRQPAPSWVWNDQDGLWSPPVPKPLDNEKIVGNKTLIYIWSEDNLSWEESFVDNFTS